MNEELSKKVTAAREQLVRAAGTTKGRGRGYGAAAQQLAVGVAREMAAAGLSSRRAAKVLGLHEATLSSWTRRSAAPVFARVEVATPTPRSAGAELRSVLPNGAHVEGLDVQTLAALVRALA